MKFDVFQRRGLRAGRRSWVILAVLLIALVAGWQLRRPVRTVHAQAVPGLRLTPPRQFPTTYRGASDALATMAAGPAALSMAAGDLDGDGYGDLAIGYAAQRGGVLAIHHGNIDAFAPQSDATFWATARGEFPSPFLPGADLVKVPVRPDFLAEGDLIGKKGSALAVAAQGGSSIAILSRDDSGAMQVQQTIAVPGSITAMDVHDLSRAKYYSLVVGVHTASGPQLLIFQGAHEGLTQAGAFPLGADASSFASGDLDGDGVPDLVVIAGAAVSVLHSGSQALQPIATPYGVSRAALGRFLHDRSPVLQMALLATDGSLHIMARQGFDSTPYTTQEMNAHKMARIAAQRAGKRGPLQLAQSAAATMVTAWKEVENDSAVGVPDGSGKTPLMFRTRVTNNGADDLMLLSAAKLTTVSHPSSQPNQAQVEDRTDLGADAVAALPARVNIDARPGVVYVSRGATAHFIITPLASQTFNVNSTADSLTANACHNNAAGCTLREAIVEANANSSGTTTINIPNGTYTLSIPRAACPAYDAKAGTLDVVESVNLVGSGETTTIIQAGTNSGVGGSPNGVDKVFSFNQDITTGVQCSNFASYTNATVAVSNLTIQNGYNRGDYTATFDGDGGAFDCDTGSSGNANVTLTDVTLNQNNAAPGDGGGFFSFNDNGGSGSVTVTNGHITNNKATGRDTAGEGGGASVGTGAFLNMTGTIVTGNNAVGGGGGILDNGPGDTFPENGMPEYIVNQVTLHGVTITNNTAGEAGGGISTGGGALTIDQESVISNNTSVGGGGGIDALLYGGFSPPPNPCLGIAGCPSFSLSFMDITVTGNNVTGTQEAQDFGGGIYLSGGYQGTTFTMNYSRIVDNTAAGDPGAGLTGAGLVWYPGDATGANNTQTIDVRHNWWGTNTDPETAKLLALDPNSSGNVPSGISITYSPWLKLSIAASPTSVTDNSSDTSTLTAGFLTDSSGGTVSASNLGALVGVPISFGSPVDGTLSGAQASIQSSGTATANFNGTHVGTGSASATVDNQTVSANITVNSNTTTSPNSPTATFSESSQVLSLGGTVTAATGDSVSGGTVTFKVFNSVPTQIGSTVTSGSVSSGAIPTTSYTLPASTPAGTYSIQATYNGSGNFVASPTASGTLTVNAAGTSISAANQTANFSTSSQSVTLSATVASGAGTVNEGTVTFTVLNGVTPVGTATTSGTVSGGSASVSYTIPASTAIGTYTIKAVYNGDSNLNSSTDTSHTLTISGGTTTTASNATATYSASSQSVTLSATVTSSAGTVNSGTVTFTVSQGVTQIGSPTSPATVSGGSASASYTLPGGTSAGTYTITASYTGAGGFGSSSDNTHTLTVNAAGTTTTAANQTANFSSSSQVVSLSATVTSPGGTVSAGTVTFTVLNGVTPVGTATTSGTVSSGNASVNYTLPANTPIGTYTIQAVYNASTNFTTSTDTAHTLTISAGTITTAANASATYNVNSQSVTLSATVTSSGGTVNSGTVTFTVSQGVTQIGSATSPASVSNGSASATYTLPGGTNAGTYTITASYTGAGGFNSSSDNTHSLMVSAASTTTTAANQTASFSSTAQSVTLSATVTSAAGTVNAGTVTFTVLNGVTPVGTATTSSTVSGGNASVSYTIPGNTPAGTYTIQAVYNGSTNFAGSSDNSHTLTIGGGSTTTTASNATATYNANSQSVTLSATVTSTGGTVNSGTVTFTVSQGVTQIGSATSPAAVSGGSASASYTLPGGTNAGTYTITASYTGAGGFTSSSDNTHTLMVSAASTTTTAANQTASFSSTAQSVTLSATVTSAAGTVNAGTVTFTVLNGVTPVGTATTSATVSGGNASVSYTIPGNTPAGTYTIQAVYSGSTNFSGSSDNSHTLTISGGSTTTTASNATATYNANSQSVTLNATVTSTGGTVNSGTVTFTVTQGVTQIGSATSPAAVSGGSASASYTLPGGTNAGTYTITASYTGAGGFTSSSDNTHTLMVSSASSTTTASNQTASFSSSPQSVTLSATITSTAGTVNGGTVTFTVLNGVTPVGTATTSATVSGGSASVSYTLPGGTATGTYTIQAVYSGSTNFTGSSDNTHTLTIGSASSSTAASNASATYSPSSQGVTLSATVTSSAGTVNAGTVTFTVLNGVTPVGSATTSGTVTGGSASVNYTLPGGTAAGTYTIQAVYSGGGGFAGSMDSSHTLTVQKATPAITWNNPANIIFGSALGNGQLNAIANVPGAFVYTPPAGTVLLVGNSQTLSAQFTPTDTTDYNNAMASVLINVLPDSTATLVLTEVLTRDPGTQDVIVKLTIANSSTNTVTGAQVTAAKIGTTGTITALPLAVPNIPAGGISSVVLTFPSSVGTSGTMAVLAMTGKSSLGAFGGSTRIVLP